MGRIDDLIITNAGDVKSKIQMIIKHHSKHKTITAYVKAVLKKAINEDPEIIKILKENQTPKK